jgi:hypothetical protein
MKQKISYKKSQCSKPLLIVILIAVTLGVLPMSRAESVPVSIKSPQTGVVTGIKFGIPLGDVSDTSKVAVFHEGRRLEADVFQMGNWSTQPSNWALIAMPVPEQWGGKSVKLDIQTDAKPQEPSGSVALSRESDSVVTINNGVFKLKLSPQGIETISSDGKSFSPDIFSPGVLFAKGAASTRTDVDARQVLPYHQLH